LLAHPFGSREAIREHQELRRLNLSDREALLTDPLADLGMLEFGDDFPSALDAVIVSEIEGVPARPAVTVVSDLLQPWPHPLNRSVDGDGSGPTKIG
jgi:hypothetical protein